MSGTVALLFAGPQIWRLMSQLVATNLAHLHDLPVTHNAMQGYGINAMLFLGKCAGPVMASCLFGALLAGLLQSRFHAATEALELRWERLNPSPASSASSAPAPSSTPRSPPPNSA